MKFSSWFLDKLRNTIRISDVVSKRVKLQRKHNDFFGLCPFHHEKTPSFSVNDEKKFYHCFGCGAHGDAINFIQQANSLGFHDAVKYLAHEYGISIPKEDTKQHTLEDKILTINKLALSWFQKNLYSSESIDILSYLSKRCITDKLISNFAIGYALNNKTGLLEYLKSYGYSINDIKLAGLLTELNDGNVIDKFRNRVIFPIFDRNQNVIAFGGRNISNGQPKYLNSPETALFKKRQMLYGENTLFNLFKKLKRLEDVYLVEGYTDVIALYRAGIENSVATLGTAISEYHIKKLWNLVPIPTICMDGDVAGIKAMERATDTVLPILSSGFSLNFVRFPKGHDPDDIVRNTNTKYLQDLLNNKITLCDSLWNLALEKADLTIPEKQALLRKELMEKVNKIKDYNVKDSYKKYFNKKIAELFSIVIRKKWSNNENTLQKRVNILKIENLPVLQRYEFHLAAIIIAMPLLFKNNSVFEGFSSIETHSEHFQKLHTNLLELFTELESCGIEDRFSVLFKTKLSDKLDKSILKYLHSEDSYFINKISAKDHDNMLALWNKTFDYYNLELLKHEYKESLNRSDNKNIDLALQLRQAIIEKGEHLSKIYN